MSAGSDPGRAHGWNAAGWVLVLWAQACAAGAHAGLNRGSARAVFPLRCYTATIQFLFSSFEGPLIGTQASYGAALLLKGFSRCALGRRGGGLGLLALLHGGHVSGNARHEVRVLLRGGLLPDGSLAPRLGVRVLILEEAWREAARLSGRATL